MQKKETKSLSPSPAGFFNIVNPTLRLHFHHKSPNQADNLHAKSRADLIWTLSHGGDNKLIKQRKV